MSAGFASSGSGGQGFAIKLEKDGDTKLGNSDGDLHQVTGTLQLNSNVFFLANGRVGLGDSAPSHKLSVGGSMEIGQYIYHKGDNNTFINFTDNRIRINAGGNNHIDCQDESSAPHKVRINNGGNNIDFVIKDNSNNVYFTADASTSRVGIGTDTPSTTLDVAGDVNFDGGAVFNESSADKDFRVESNHVENMFFVLGSDNRIGIGTNSPQHTLDIQERAGVEATIRLVGSADVGIRLAADSDNSGENDNPYIDFYQDGLNSNSRNQRLATLGMEGDAGATFTDSLANTFFMDAAYPQSLGSGGRTLQLANDSVNNGHKARITLEGTNGNVGIHTNTPGSPLEVSGNVRLHGTTTSQFYVTEVKEQDLGSGTSSNLSVASGTMLLDADSINGIDMGGMEVHELAFPRGNDSGTRLSLIVKSTTNSTFILPSGLISGSFDSLNDSAGVTATEYVWISEGTHQAWHQVK